MRFVPAIALLGLAAGIASAQTQPPPDHLLRFPDVHGDMVVFTCEGDLWLGSLSGGTARRITNDEGTEAHAHFSPDGTLLAFTGAYDGNPDVYVMPVSGGMPKRLTWDPDRAEVVGWTPDGKNVVFRSRRDTAHTTDHLFTVPVGGGLPRPVLKNDAGLASFSPDGKRVAYTPFSIENAHWKRYQGGWSNDVFIANLANNTFQQITTWQGQDLYPVWAGNQIFFTSDRDGNMDLYSYDLSTKQTTRRTTHTGYDVKWPASDGKTVVYQFGAGLETLDVASGQVKPLAMALTSDRIHTRTRYYNPARWLAGYGIGPTGKRVVMSSRGEIATLPAESGEIRNVAHNSGARDQYPTWSPDGKTIAFVSDRSGEQQLYLVSASKDETPRAVTKLTREWLLAPVWSLDSKKLAFGTRDLGLYLVTLGSTAGAAADVSRIDASPRSEMTSYDFSPDSRYLAYDKTLHSRVSAVFVYDTAQKQVHQVTDGMASDHTPAFDPAGKYLYYLSERSVTPHIDPFDFDVSFDKPTKVSLLVLAADGKSPFLVDDDEEPGATDATGTAVTKKTIAKDAKAKKAATDAAAGKDADETTDATTKTPAATKMDWDGLMDRRVDVPVDAGGYWGLAAGDGRIFLADRTEEADQPEGPGPAAPETGSTLRSFDLKTKKTTTVADHISGFDLSADRKKMLIREGNAFQIVDPNEGEATPDKGKLDISDWQLTVDPQAEWRQMFEEAWRSERDFLYDPNIHRVDWNAVHDRYARLLPAVGSRDELSTVIGDMIAEISVSHAFTGAGDTRYRPTVVGIGRLGADLEPDAASGFFRVTRLLKGDGFDDDTRSPLLAPGIGLKTGDYILAVAGKPVNVNEDPNALLANMGGKVVTVRVNSKPTAEGARDVRVKAMPTDQEARYQDWVAGLRAYVASKDPRIGYVHIPDMENAGLTAFTKAYYANLTKDAMVIDVRYNSGGYVSNIILDRLSRILWNYFLPRYGESDWEHPTAFPGHITVLCNEETASDGEDFTEGFKRLHRGKIIGMRTWGGEVGFNTGEVSLVDGGYLTAPEFAAWSPERKWIIEGHGSVPDIEVQNDPASVAAGQDKQLDAAITELQQEMRDAPVPHPQPPDFENRSGVRDTAAPTAAIAK